MIPKPMKDHRQPSNFRPISLLNTISKIMERLVLTRILSWLEEHKILAEEQSGFRKSRQTNEQIFRIIQDGLTAFNKRQMLGSLFIDIEKAFDKVWINGLLFKLSSYNIPNYMGKWVSDYLTDRSFQVRTGEELSSTRKIETGVPQGSVLGPVLFIIFFNDVVKTEKNIFDPKEALFADDVAIWLASSSFKTIQTRLQKRVDEIKTWMTNWRTKISVQKTVYSILNKGGFLDQNKVSLNYDGAEIKAERNPKFLGITLDPSLNLHNHAKDLTIRAQKRLNMLKRIRCKGWGASSKLIISSYKTLIRPIIEYAPFTQLIMSQSSQSSLQKIQNSAIRISTYWPIRTTTKQMNDQAKLEILKERASSLTGKFINKVYDSNNLLRALVDEYKIAESLIEGSHSKGKARRTILGVSKQTNDLP